MATQPKPKSRKHQIEPLDWAEAANSPALKGMMSFLEISPEDIRSGHHPELGTQLTADRLRTSARQSLGPVSETRIGSLPDSSEAINSNRTGANEREPISAQSQPAVPVSETLIGWPKDVSAVYPASAVTAANDDRAFKVGRNESLVGPTPRETRTGSDSLNGDPRSLTESAGRVRELSPPGHGDTLPESDTHTGSRAWPAIKRLPASETLTGSLASDGNHQPADVQDEVHYRPGTEAPTHGDPLTGAGSHTGSEARTGSETHTGSGSPAGSILLPIGDSHTGSESLRAIKVTTDRDSAGRRLSDAEETVRVSKAQESLTGSESLPVSDSLLYSVRHFPENRAGTESLIGQRGMLIGSISSQNRKIRKCKLMQDAHSAGEEHLYGILWAAGKIDPAYPAGSRTVRMGYAELADRARMHKTNVRLNIVSLKAKLAIDILDEHNSRDLVPRLYRIFSFKEILERRKAAGLEYVIRQKNVVFVTPTGEVIPLDGLTKTAKTRRSTIRPQVPVSDSLPLGSSASGGQPREDSRDQTALQKDKKMWPEFDVQPLSQALNRYWPVDEAAAHQLFRACRRVRPDAQADEIVFFVEEKSEMIRGNRNITNPTGLILATVPQCFEGRTFEEFRRRRNEHLRLAAEEEARKREQEKEMEEWVNREREKMKAIIANPDSTDSEKARAQRILSL
jgi:hypothetical protein